MTDSGRPVAGNGVADDVVRLFELRSAPVRGRRQAGQPERPDAPAVAAKSGAGMQEWYAWLRRRTPAPQE